MVAACAKPSGIITSYINSPIYPSVKSSIILPAFVTPSITSQYHAQDALGQYTFGYSSPLSTKSEIKTADGITRGGYNYLDANGLLQSVTYTSDAINGFRVAATNLPVAPVAPLQGLGPNPVTETPEVIAAKSAHLSAHAEAKASTIEANTANAFATTSLLPAGKLVTNTVPIATAPGVAIASPLVGVASVPNFYSYTTYSGQPAVFTAPISPIYGGYKVIAAPITNVVAETTSADSTGSKVVDEDTVEVATKDAGAQGRISAVSAHSAVSSGVVPGVTLTESGVPVETPEVIQAKAAHLAALESAKVHGQW